MGWHIASIYSYRTDADGNPAAFWDMAACVGGDGAIYSCLFAGCKS